MNAIKATNTPNKKQVKSEEKGAEESSLCTKLSRLQHFQRYKLRYEILLISLYLFINNTLNATSVVMEAKRNNQELPFALWEPFSWEYTSALSSLIIFPFIVFLLKKYPFNWQAIKRSLMIYFAASIAFSFSHVGLMVLGRELIYGIQGLNYDFGDFWYEMFYEYRKDLWGFIFFVVVIYAYQFIVSRLQGEANPIVEGEREQAPTKQVPIDRLLVKKLGKEFIIKVENVEWLESSGNYVNLYIDDRIYPLRATMTQLVTQLENKGFCRIHRSFAVRLDAIESITPLASGDSEIRMQSGKQLQLSRRYKEAFKMQLG